MEIRTLQRRLFSEEKNLEFSDKIIKLRLIEKKTMLMIKAADVQLFLFSGDIKSNVIEKEIDELENYIDRWQLLQFKLKQLSLSERADVFFELQCFQQNTLLCYSKIHLPTFDRDLRNRLRFWGQLERVDKDYDQDLHGKFAYLLQSMQKGSVAEETFCHQFSTSRICRENP